MHTRVQAIESKSIGRLLVRGGDLPPRALQSEVFRYYSQHVA